MKIKQNIEMNYVFIEVLKCLLLGETETRGGGKSYLALFTPGRKTRPSIVIREQFGNKLLGQDTKGCQKRWSMAIESTWRDSKQNQFIAFNQLQISVSFSIYFFHATLALSFTRSLSVSISLLLLSNIICIFAQATKQIICFAIFLYLYLFLSLSHSYSPPSFLKISIFQLYLHFFFSLFCVLQFSLQLAF